MGWECCRESIEVYLLLKVAFLLFELCTGYIHAPKSARRLSGQPQHRHPHYPTPPPLWKVYVRLIAFGLVCWMLVFYVTPVQRPTTGNSGNEIECDDVHGPKWPASLFESHCPASSILKSSGRPCTGMTFDRSEIQNAKSVCPVVPWPLTVYAGESKNVSQRCTREKNNGPSVSVLSVRSRRKGLACFVP